MRLLQTSVEWAILGQDLQGTESSCLWSILTKELHLPKTAVGTPQTFKTASLAEKCHHMVLHASRLRAEPLAAWRQQMGFD